VDWRRQGRKGGACSGACAWPAAYPPACALPARRACGHCLRPAPTSLPSHRPPPAGFRRQQAEELTATKSGAARRELQQGRGVRRPGPHTMCPGPGPGMLRSRWQGSAGRGEGADAVRGIRPARAPANDLGARGRRSRWTAAQAIRGASQCMRALGRTDRQPCTCMVSHYRARSEGAGESRALVTDCRPDAMALTSEELNYLLYRYLLESGVFSDCRSPFSAGYPRARLLSVTRCAQC
jgi:hypothetical protein